MEKERFLKLWEQYQAGILVEKDQQELEHFIKSGSADKFLEEWMHGQRQNDIDIDIGTMPGRGWHWVWERIQAEILIKENGNVSILHFIKANYRVAAAVLIFCVSALILYYSLQEVNRNKNVGVDFADVQLIVPGRNGALLTLGDGRRIVLSDSLANTMVAHQGDKGIWYANGSISYQSAREKSATMPLVYNTVTTPFARKIKIILADGTKVWLNAGSSLHFPTVFATRGREVTITGEGYFEVAKNTTSPFIVHTKDGGEIKVLGTHFNINAYEDDGTIKTTLLEGAVLVKKGKEEKLLQPGQQAETITTSNTMKVVNDLNLSAIVAWKDGMFEFKGASIEVIMSSLARWYDVEVVFQDKTDAEFVAKISSDVPLQQILDILEQTKQVHFKVVGKKVIVTKW